MAEGKGAQTRARILDAAQALVVAKGFGATSIEELITETGLTKSGFFYHFKDKNQLAKALLERYVEADERVYDEVFGRARELAEDPLQAFLIGLKLLSEVLADMPNGHPGCLVASSCYYDRLFSKEIQDINREAVLLWRRRFRAMFEEIAATHPPRAAIDLDELADMVSTVLEGGIVMSKALGDPRSIERQLLVLRTFVRLLFEKPG